MKKLAFLFVLVFSLVTNVNAYKIEKTNDTRTKVKVTLNEQSYFYEIEDTSNIPTPFGAGLYTFEVYENIEGTKYRKVKTIKSQIKDDCFTTANYWVNYSEELTTFTAALVQGNTTAEEKINTIYNYIVNNYKYNYEKINNIPNNYIPNPEAFLKEDSGICSDFATLFAAMLRSQNIPIKVVVGYTSAATTYHAWNQVYINGN